MLVVAVDAGGDGWWWWHSHRHCHLVDNTGGGRYHRHCPYSMVGLLLLSLMVVALMTLVVLMQGM